jgi:hypothetical protein
VSNGAELGFSAESSFKDDRGSPVATDSCGDSPPHTWTPLLHRNRAVQHIHAAGELDLIRFGGQVSYVV